MKQYRTFIVDSFHFEESTGVLKLTYGLDDEIAFTETLTFPEGFTLPADRSSFDAALFGLHVIGGISYFKTCLPKKIEIRSGVLTKEQADFWNAVYENGLGEFFFRNKIDFRGLINVPFDEDARRASLESRSSDTHGKALVPIGGGKDSLVTIELLKKEGVDLTLFRLGSHPLITKMAEIVERPLLTVERTLDPQLFELNKQGALNGHIPISAYLSWLTVVTSILYGFDSIIMSNEKSANEGNVQYLGKDINHQWSKSEEFERMFSDYVHRYITPSIAYFSLLRPLSELQIAKLFAGFPQYFPYATSCNANWKIASERSRDRWCGQCPKCAFAFVILGAFIPREQLLTMFGTNLLDAKELQTFYRELLGLEGFKPFECVGTVAETRAAFSLMHQNGEWKDSEAMEAFVRDVLPSLHVKR
jgi:hypothetical protein